MMEADKISVIGYSQLVKMVSMHQGRAVVQVRKVRVMLCKSIDDGRNSFECSGVLLVGGALNIS
jgi:hypothetical protein